MENNNSNEYKKLIAYYDNSKCEGRVYGRLKLKDQIFKFMEELIKKKIEEIKKMTNIYTQQVDTGKLSIKYKNGFVID